MIKGPFLTNTLYNIPCSEQTEEEQALFTHWADESDIGILQELLKILAAGRRKKQLQAALRDLRASRPAPQTATAAQGQLTLSQAASVGEGPRRSRCSRRPRPRPRAGACGERDTWDPSTVARTAAGVGGAAPCHQDSHAGCDLGHAPAEDGEIGGQPGRCRVQLSGGENCPRRPVGPSNRLACSEQDRSTGRGGRQQ